MKAYRLPLVLLLASLVIATVQAKEVIARIQQAKKFSGYGYDDTDPLITAGYSATVLFIIGSFLGVLLCIAGYQITTKHNAKKFRIAFVFPITSIILFGLTWIGMIISPVVELFPR